MSKQAELIYAAQLDYNARSKMDYTGLDCLYDTQTLAAATLFPGNLTFFVSPANNGRTYAQTNMQVSGQLANNDAFLIMAARFQWFFNAAPADVIYLCNNCWLNFKFYNREFFWGIPEMFPGGSVAYVSAASSTALITATYPSPAVSTINGVPSIHNYFSLGDEGVLLRDNDQLKVVLTNEGGPFTTSTAAAGGTGLTLRVWLDGYRIRSSA